jgi:hypothetical protein
VAWVRFSTLTEIFLFPPAFKPALGSTHRRIYRLPRILHGHSCTKILPSVSEYRIEGTNSLKPSLFRLVEVPRSNIGRDTATVTENFQLLSSVSPGSSRGKLLKVSHDRFLPHPFQFIIHAVWSVLLSAGLSKLHIQIQRVSFVAGLAATAVAGCRGGRRLSVR